MKNRFSIKTGWPVLVILTMMTLAHVSMLAQDGATSSKAENSLDSVSRGARALEGTWNVVVTIRNCDTGNPIAVFRAMDLFTQGGSAVDTNAAPPSTRGPGFGSWAYTEEQTYTATIRFFMYNPDGSLAGMRKLVQNIAMNAEADAWASTVNTTNYDPIGNITSVGCATAVATQFP